MTLIQGLVAGGAAVYLQNRLEAGAAEKSADTWATLTLQVNHILLLTAETLTLACCPLGAFKTLVQSVYILTPVPLMASLFALGLGDIEGALSPRWAELANKVYRIAMAALALGTLALGDPLFAAGSLSMLATDLAVSGAVHQAFVHLTKIPALCALAGYGSQVFSALSNSHPPSPALLFSAGSTAFIALKLCFIDPMVFLIRLLPASGESSSSSDSSYQYPVYVGHHHVDYSLGVSSDFFSGGDLFCRNTGVWA